MIKWETQGEKVPDVKWVRKLVGLVHDDEMKGALHFSKDTFAFQKKGEKQNQLNDEGSSNS